MEHRATLEYSEGMLRRAAFAYWRRVVGSVYGVATAVVAGCFAALVGRGDRSWVVGVLGSVLALAIVVAGLAFVVRLRGSLATFRRMSSRKAEMVATDDAFCVSSELGTMRMPWSGIAEIWRYAEFWILVLSSRQLATLPTAGLSDDARAFITERVRAAGGRVGA